MDGCTTPNTARGWCNVHYRRWRRTGDPLRTAWERGNPEANFWAKVERGADDECWPFTGAITEDGYGHFLSPIGIIAHRYAYTLLVGPIPRGDDLDHLCHSRSSCTAVKRACPHRRCVNPAHLDPVGPVEHGSRNKPGVRGVARGAQQRAKTHCPKGHEYTSVNTYVDKRGSRNCRTCAREKSQQRQLTEAGRAYQREYQRERMRRVRAAAKQQQS